MVQGDSIGRVFSNEEYGMGTFDVSPPTGIVWLITYIEIWSGANTNDPSVSIGGRGVPPITLKNVDMRFFVSSNTPMIISFSSEYQDYWHGQYVYINGVQFK